MMLLAPLLLVQPYIGLKVTWGTIDPPLADVLGALLCVTVLASRRPLTLIGWPAAATFAGIGVLSALRSDVMSPTEGLWWLFRHVGVLYLCYGVALAACIRDTPREEVRRWLLRGVAIAAGISIATSVTRIFSGDALAASTLAWLTPNHKTIAVWMAPLVPVLPGRLRRLVGVALVLSMAKAAWLIGGVGLAWSMRVPLTRILAATVVALALLTGLPWVVDSAQLQDTVLSRHSLNVRQWKMFTAHPLIGCGPGSSVIAEMVEYPHYRINHVEAHGVLQKVAGELGLLGLAAWTWFTAGIFQRARSSTATDRHAWTGVLLCLHLSLLLSTEGFTHTHWIPLGITLGELARR